VCEQAALAIASLYPCLHQQQVEDNFPALAASLNKMLMLQQLCKFCRTCFKFYYMFYFTCDRSLSYDELDSRHETVIRYIVFVEYWLVTVDRACVTPAANIKVHRSLVPPTHRTAYFHSGKLEFRRADCWPRISLFPHPLPGW